MKVLEKLKNKAKKLSIEAGALYYAYKDPRTPWYAKAFAACVVGYALSPIDLIPDFIPGLGHLDDLVLVPLGVALAVKMIPKQVYEECRAKASGEAQNARPVNLAVAALVIIIWILIAAAAISAAIAFLKHG